MISRYAYLLVAVAAVAACSRAEQVTPEDGFERLVNNSVALTNTSTPVYFNAHTKGWSKRRFRVADVQRSLTASSPDNKCERIGSVTFKLEISQTDFAATEAEATAITTYTSSPSLFDVAVTYCFVSDRWSTKRINYEQMILGDRVAFDLKPSQIVADRTSSPNAGLYYWTDKASSAAP